MRIRSAAALLLVLVGLVAPTAVPPAAAARPTVTVWPRTDLVDDQPLRITLRDWQPSTYLVALMCRGGAPAWGNNCDHQGTLHPGPEGNLRVRRPADVIVDRRVGGPVDCRVSACELLVRDANGPHVPNNAVVRVPLEFDPAGPDPVRPPLTATPDDGLRDGDEVQVTGQAFPIGAYAPTAPSDPPAEGDDGPARPVYLYQCRADPQSRRDCHQGSVEVGMTTAGNFSRRFVVRSRLFTSTGATVDCLAEPCALTASSNGQFSEAGLVPLDFDPTGPVTPPPTVAVTPDTGLVDGQTVSITGEHFPPNAGLTLALCPPDATGYDFQACHDVFSLAFGSDAEGDIATTHAVHATWDRPSFDCRAVTCSFVVTWSGTVDDAPRAPIELDPAASLLDQRLTASPATDLTGGQVVEVTGEDYYPTDFTRVVQCVHRRTQPDRPACALVDQLVNPPGEEFTSFTVEAFKVRRFPFTDDGRVDCTRRWCFLASYDWENNFVRGSRLTFSP